MILLLIPRTLRAGKAEISHLVISTRTDEANVKIRYDQLGIKVLIETRLGMEQWAPLLKAAFPLQADLLRAEVFPILKVELPQLRRSAYNQPQFLAEVIGPHPDLVTAQLSKQRSKFTIDGCLAELAEIEVDGQPVKTVAVESEDVAAVLRAKETLGLAIFENVNYIRATKRMIGMA